MDDKNKECKWCTSSIPIRAKTCIHCNHSQSIAQTFIVSGIAPIFTIIISILATFITLYQANESVKDRVKSEEAAKLALKANETAKKTVENLKSTELNLLSLSLENLFVITAEISELFNNKICIPKAIYTFGTYDCIDELDKYSRTMNRAILTLKKIENNDFQSESLEEYFNELCRINLRSPIVYSNKALFKDTDVDSIISENIYSFIDLCRAKNNEIIHYAIVDNWVKKSFDLLEEELLNNALKNKNQAIASFSHESQLIFWTISEFNLTIYELEKDGKNLKSYLKNSFCKEIAKIKSNYYTTYKERPNFNLNKSVFLAEKYKNSNEFIEHIHEDNLCGGWRY